jgi:hypothetical protein
MAASVRGNEHHRRQHDHVNREYKHSRVPDVAQPAKAGGDPAQRDLTTQAATSIIEVGAT